MTIENVSYTNADQTSITAMIDGQQWGIPVNPNNRHYQMIQRWLAESPDNTIAAYVAPEITTALEPLPASTLTPLLTDEIQEL